MSGESQAVQKTGAQNHPTADIPKDEMPSMDQIQDLKEMEEVYNLNVKYRTQEDWALLKDKPQRAYFMKMTSFQNKKDEAVKAAIFAGEKGAFMAAQMLLVESVEKLAPGTPVIITYEGKRDNKTSDGSTNLFDISVMGLPGLTQPETEDIQEAETVE